MNSFPSETIAAYRSYVDDHFDDEQLSTLAAFLGLELTDEETEDALDLIVETITSPGKLESRLTLADENAVGFLLRLLDLGEVLPTRCLMPRGHGELEHYTKAFTLLRQTGLISLSLEPESVVVIQPLARMLLAKQLCEYRRQRLELTELQDLPGAPLRSILLLVVNFVRSHGMRVTNKGDFYRRHHDKAKKLFAAAHVRWDVSLFDFALVALSRSGVLRVNDEGFFFVTPEKLRAMITSPAQDFALEFLFRSDSTSSLLISLIELFRGWRSELPDGWASSKHVTTHGSMHDFHHYEQDSKRALQAALELQILGLVESATSDDEKWFRLSPQGEALASFLENEDEDRLPDEDRAASSPEAIIQPNLEIIVDIDGSAEAHWRVGAIATLTSVDTRCHYTIDKNHCQAVFSREGLIFDEWIEALRSVAKHGIPENIERTLRSWIGQQASVELFGGTVMRLAQEEGEDGQPSPAVQNNLAEAARKLKAKRIAPGIYVIPENTRDHKIAAALHENNLVAEDLSFHKPRQWSTEPGSATREEMQQTLQRELEEVRTHRRHHLESANYFHHDEAPPEKSAAPETYRVEDDAPPAEGGAWAGDSWADVSELLHAAVRHGKAVEIELNDLYHNTSRVLVPESILRRGSRNYLTGLCLESREHRAFPLEYVKRARLVEREE